MLEVRTGCRIHFGLMELAAGAPLRFAGLGLMLQEPGYEVVISEKQPADHSALTTETEEIQQRIQAVIDLRLGSESATHAEWLRRTQVQVQSSLPLHSGLGAGTQLACAVATGLELWLRDQTSSAAGWQSLPDDWTTRDLLRLSGRGLRSAIGLTGFRYGGLLLDEGYTPEFASDLWHRPISSKSTMLPSSWRVVLLMPNCTERVHGRREAELMEQLGRTPHPHAGRMLELANQIMQLGRIGTDFASFTACLEQYMRFGAQLFYGYQQGLYNGVQVTEAVELARTAGLRGVGQSSWGPIVFGFAEDPQQADFVARQLTSSRPEWLIRTAVPAQSGAQVRWLA